MYHVRNENVREAPYTDIIKSAIQEYESNLEPEHRQEQYAGLSEINTPNSQLRPNASYNRVDRICNPCGCCFLHRDCNLRRNCLIIAVMAFIFAFALVGYFQIIPPDCETIKAERHEYYTTACRRGNPPKPDQIRRQLILLNSVCIATLCLAGIFGMVAVFARSAASAFGAVVMWMGSMIIMIVESHFLISFLEKWPSLGILNGHLNLLAESGNHIHERPLAGERKVYIGLFASFYVFHQLFFSLCCFQHGRQILAGQDLDPSMRRYNIDNDAYTETVSSAPQFYGQHKTVVSRVSWQEPERDRSTADLPNHRLD